MNGTRRCSLDSCPCPAVTRFVQRELCSQHFLSQCYEDLDRLDAWARSSQLDHSGAATLKIFVEECSRCALEVSLKYEHLDNLMRARLLDILLWAAELLPMLAKGLKSDSETTGLAIPRPGNNNTLTQGAFGPRSQDLLTS